MTRELERVVIKQYLAAIEQTAKSDSRHCVAARELLDELCDNETRIEHRLRRIEEKPETPVEHHLWALVHLVLNRRTP